MKKDKTTITIPNENPFGRKGHTPHRSGAGPHKDKRQKREQDKKRKELENDG